MVHHSRIIGAGLRVLAAIASKSQTIFQSFTTQSFVCVLAITGLFLLLPVRSAAQVGSATLRGTVIDSTGAAVEGAQVSAELADSGSARTSVTMATGEYFFSALKPGVYTISVTKTGFSTFKQTNFTLELDQAGTLDTVLKVGSVSQVVEVNTETAEIQTADSTLGGVITTREVVDLPLNGRMFTQLLELEPGTVPVDVSQNNGKQPGFGSGSAVPAINGGTNRSNLFYIDGIYATDPFFAGFSFSPSIDAIQEFKEQTHTDQTEFGGSTGATVTVATRSGTNSFHGSAFEFLRNDAFDARNTFAFAPITNLPTKYAYRQNQFGGTVGGPIIKNKLFFFAYYEGGRQIQGAPAYSFVPTANQRNGDFSGLGPNGQPLPILYDPATYNPVTQTETTFLAETGVNAIPTGRIDTQMQTFLNGTYPLPNSNSTLGNYLNTSGNTGTQDQGSIRVDYNMGPNDVLYGRFSKGHATNSSVSALANTFQTGFSGYNTGGTWVHTFSPTLITTVTIGVNNLDIPQAIIYPVDQGALFTASGLGAGFTPFPGNTSGPQVPAISLSGNTYGGFWNGSGPIGPMTTGQIGASATKVLGDHILKFGGAWYKTWMYTNWAGNGDNFSNQGTWNAACQFGYGAGGVVANPAAVAACPAYNPNNAATSNLNAAAGGDPVASLLLSLPINAAQQLGNSGVNLRMVNSNLFVQDSWKISRKLTFNYGVRWDYNSPVTELYNRLPTYNIYTQTYIVPNGDKDLPSGSLPANVALSGRNSPTNPRYTDFSPRLGVAYQINSKTVVRAGFGRSFDSYSEALQVAQQDRGSWPSGLAQNTFPGNVNTAGISTKPDGTLYTGQNPFVGTATVPATPFPLNLSFGDVKWQPDSSWQWNLQVQRDLGNVGIFSVAYVGSQTEHTTLALPYNVALQPTTTPCIPSCDRPDTIYGTNGGTDLSSVGTSNYNAMQVNLTRPFIHGFAYTASFTWSKNMAIGNCGDFYQSCVQDPYTLKQTEYGPSGLNVPLLFTVSALYELPFGRGKQYVNDGIGARILGGWQLNGIISLRSGLPVNVTNGQIGDAANVGGGLQRGDIIGDPQSSAAHTPTSWFNSAAFANPTAGNYGTAGLNSLTGPAYRDVDFSVLRTFTFTERLRLQFRAEMFDLFNHPNYDLPGGNVGGGGFNQISHTVGGGLAPGGNRDIQFALKLMF